MESSQYNAYNDYRDRWYQPGSAFYYSILHLPEPSKQDLICLHVFFSELLHVVSDYREITVAMNRLQWWQEEIHSLAEHRPRHPISKELITVIDRHKLPFTLFHDICSSIAVLFHEHPAKTWNDFDLLAQKLFGNHQSLQLQCCGYPVELNQNYCNRIAPGLMAGFFLHRLGQDLHRGFYYFPLSILSDSIHSAANDSGSMSPADNLSESAPAKSAHTEPDNLTSEQIRKQLAEQTQMKQFSGAINSHALHAFKQSLNIKHPARQAGSACAQISIMHTTAMLSELAGSGPSLLTHKISLTPFRYLWISLKTRFRLRLFGNKALRLPQA